MKIKKFPNEIKKGDKFISPDGIIYICDKAFFGLSVLRKKWACILGVMKKKLPKDVVVVRRIELLAEEKYDIISIIHINQANQEKWVLKQGFNIVDKNGYIRGGQHIKLKRYEGSKF